MQKEESVRRVIVWAFGGTEQVMFDTAAEAPLVGPRQSLIDVEACGVNYLDVDQRSGRYKFPLPDILLLGCLHHTKSRFR